MTPDNTQIINNKKYVWDGATYDSEDLARQTMETYEKDGFEVQMVTEGDKYLVYSRRIAAQTEN